MKEDMANVSLPDQWLDHNTIEFCQLTKCTDETRQVTRSLSIFGDLTWLVKVNGQVVLAKSKVLANYSPILASSRIAEDMIKQIDKSILCPGNPEPEFVSLCKKQDGVVKGQRGHGDVVAFTDEHSVTDSSGVEHLSTVRRVDCDLLCLLSSRYPKCCQSCQSFRSTLRSSVSWLCKEKDMTAPSSHTAYQRLPDSAKNERPRQLHHMVRLSKQRMQRMESRVQTLVEREGVVLDDDDVISISSLFSEVTPAVEESFPHDSPQRVLWEQQKVYNNLPDKRQMRWHM